MNPIVLHDRELNLAGPVAGSSGEATPIADRESRALAAGVARGDEGAFRELYDRYHARLFCLLLVLARGDEGVASDVVQATMLTAAARLKTVKSEEHLWHWLARVARQHLIKQWRKQGREPMLVPLAEAPEVIGTESDERLEEKLDSALRALPEAERETIERFYFDGLSHQEIADHLGTTAKAVSSRLERARVRLRLLLTQMLSHEN